MATLEPSDVSCLAKEEGNNAHPTPAAPQPSHSVGEEDTSEPGHEKQKEVVLCQYFVMGKCRFGNKCRLSHSESQTADSELVAANRNDDDEEEENEDKRQKKKNPKVKQKQSYQEKETNKKPRMRTADDVISRILWDPSVDSSQFIVGYVDRFLGVLERPFCEFNWESNPCDCDYSTELALPRHRIQYFAYRGQRVWDRHSRTDLVFGSTGQALAPPFGGEGEVQEQEGATPNEDVCGLAESEVEPSTSHKHLEEVQQNEMNIHTPDSALRSKQGSLEQERLQETCAAVPTDRVLQHSEVAEEIDGLENECEENHEDLSVGALHVDDPAAVMEQIEKKPGGRPPKKQPTHFVTFRANTPAILSCFEQLRAELTAALPSSAPHWSTVSSLHVTLCLLVLPSPAEVDAAVDVLRRFAELDRNPPVAVTFPLKLKHFNGRVLFLSPQPQLPLQQLNSGLQEAYREQGLLHRHSYNPRYHLTLAKVQDRNVERIFDGVESLKVGKGLHFGRLPVNTLHLCAMGGCKVDGFYEILCTVTLR